jgi:hypothetical protein
VRIIEFESEECGKVSKVKCLFNWDTVAGIIPAFSGTDGDRGRRLSMRQKRHGRAITQCLEVVKDAHVYL